MGWLQGAVGKHAKVLQSMCQQHAGIRCLARIEMFKGPGEKRVRSQTCFFKAKLFQKSSTENTPGLKNKTKQKGTSAQSFTVDYFGITTPADISHQRKTARHLSTLFLSSRYVSKEQE